MKRLTVILLISRAFIAGAQNCVYNPLSNTFDTYYEVTKIKVTDITASSAIITGYFTEGQNGNTPYNFCASYDHSVTLGFFYSTDCSAIAMWNLNPNRLDAPFFPPAGIARTDTTLYVKADSAVFPGTGIHFSLKAHDLMPRQKYYVRWFVKDTVNQGDPRMRRLINAYNFQTDSFITPDCSSFENALVLQTGIARNITSSSASINCKYKVLCTISASSPYIQITQGICWDTIPNFDVLKYFTSNRNVLFLNSQGIYKAADTSSCTFNLTGLIQGKKYYAQSVYYWCDYKAKALWGGKRNWRIAKGNLVSFFVQQPPPITNNFIISKNRVVCPDKSGLYESPSINASLPAGGHNTYTYLWQRSLDSSRTWQAAESPTGNYAQNYQVSQGHTANTFVQYRRIVNSGSLADTSRSVAISFVGSGFQQNVIVSMQAADSKSIMLTATVNHPLGDLSVQWQDSTDVKGFITLLPGLKDKLLLPVTTGTNNYYRSLVNYGSGCPTFKSKVIGISPPDGNGNIYPTIQINTQTWMINNLRATRFNDGTTIERDTSAASWISGDKPAYCWYNYDSLANSALYGALYNAYVVIHTNKNVCPVGWRVANSLDWSTLSTLVGGATGATAGQSLKTADNWMLPNNANNDFNFNATPGGEITQQGIFNNKLSAGSWWAPGQNLTHFKAVNFSNAIYYVNTTGATNAKNAGFSVRCMRYNN